MKNLNNFKIFNKKVLFRADLNLPMNNGKVSDFSRINQIKSSIKKLLKQKNKIFIITHFGRPKGKYNKKYSIKFLCNILEKELEVNKILFFNSLLEKSISERINNVNFGEICLFENIRFYPEEENNDENFAKLISSFFDVYVNDAFSASHRKHTSIYGISKYLPAVAGDGLVEEIQKINSFLHKPKKPNIAIIGGSKISTKIHLLNNLIKLFDVIVLGGAMANTFLYSNNINIGNSVVEKNLCQTAKEIQIKATDNNCKLILPIDVVCAKSFIDKNSIRHCKINNVLSDQIIYDIGEKTTYLIKKEILKSRMILWNGPLGAFEKKPFDQSTNEVAHIIKNYCVSLKISSIAGGGDTISAIKNAKAEDGFTHISTAGGAFLEWLEGYESPGILALKENLVS
tara:strand:+ start:336 stop:1535 length:1200 start_codon:yes stop_codon:yes gene_type:complete